MSNTNFLLEKLLGARVVGILVFELFEKALEKLELEPTRCFMEQWDWASCQDTQYISANAFADFMVGPYRQLWLQRCQ